jgi:hypothetical protein
VKYLEYYGTKRRLSLKSENIRYDTSIPNPSLVCLVHLPLLFLIKIIPLSFNYIVEIIVCISFESSVIINLDLKSETSF